MLSDNVFNEYLGQILAMAVLNLITLSAAFLEHDDLVILEVFENLRFHRGALYYRCAHLNLTVVVCKQDPIEAHRRIYFA